MQALTGVSRLYVRNKLHDKTLKSQKYYTVIYCGFRLHEMLFIVRSKADTITTSQLICRTEPTSKKWGK